MSAYYIERNNISGNGGMGQGQEGNNQAQRPGTPNGAPMGGANAGQTGSMGQQGSMNSGANGERQTTTNGSAANSSAAASTRDYRDDLRELLDRAHSERGLTRYRLCKQMGIDSGTLSNVLAKRRHFSLEKLEQILDLLGYRLSFVPDTTAGANGSANGAASSGAGSNGAASNGASNGNASNGSSMSGQAGSGSGSMGGSNGMSSGRTGM